MSLAIAGGSKHQDALEAIETMGTDPSLYIKVPWDIMEQYKFRASKVSQLVPEESRCQWLEKMDRDERAVWVKEFRESGETLGKIAQDNFNRRAALWQAPLIQAVHHN